MQRNSQRWNVGRPLKTSRSFSMAFRKMLSTTGFSAFGACEAGCKSAGALGYAALSRLRAVLQYVKEHWSSPVFRLLILRK